MKKISLKDVKYGLKRDEMRVISGGCGCGNKIINGHLWVCTDGKWVDMGPYDPVF